MTLSREKKGQVLKDLKERIQKAKIVVFVNFHGLNTSLSRELRCLISKADAKYLVAKKTLIKKALDEFKFKGEMPNLEGETALVLGQIRQTGQEEIVGSVKSLSKFSKEHSGIVVLGGIFDESYVNKETISKIAQLPNREVLIGQFMNVINAPIRGMVVTLNGAMRNFVNVLNQISEFRTR